MLAFLDLLSKWAIPVVVGFIPLYGYLKGVKVYEAFIDGAEEGLELAVRIVPVLVAIFVAMGVFRTSGAMELVVGFLDPLLSVLGVPGQILPLALIRPLSGGGALGLTAELIRTCGPDSYVGRLASTMQGSTDTTFYVLTLYFGSVGIKNSRHALTVGLFGDFIGFVASLAIVRLFFGY
jgi:spore maturation protein B